MIDQGALQANAKVLVEEMAPAKLIGVVKGNAYGHGYDATVPALHAGGIEDFAVFSAHEASHVRRVAPDVGLQVMGHQKAKDLTWLAQNHVAVWANDPDDVEDIVAGHWEGPALGVHVEVETGMYRTGLDPDVAVATAVRIADGQRTRLDGLCTHLAGAEERANDGRIDTQIEVFDTVRSRLAEVGLRPLCHVASSSAALRWPHRRYDAVRIGIASYGHWPTKDVQQEVQKRGAPVRLRPALSWHSWVMACKEVPAGACVGYGDAFCTAQPVRIAIIPVGYGDGFSRLLSMRGHALIRGRRASIVGRVNMNMIMVLVDDTVQPGDDVVLVGRQDNEQIGVHSFAEWNEVIDYEFMARLSWDTPRVAWDPDA